MYQLPEYEPSDEIWKKIEAGLNDDILKKSLVLLPVYEPAEESWTEISRKLNSYKTGISIRRWASVAAVILLVCCIWLYRRQDNTAITYSQERLDKQLLLSAADDSRKQYEMIVAYCEEQTYVCQNPEFKELKTELEELNTASNQLKEAVGQYNTEPELITQLSAIEQQKADIIRKMVMKI